MGAMAGFHVSRDYEQCRIPRHAPYTISPEPPNPKPPMTPKPYRNLIDISALICGHVTS